MEKYQLLKTLCSIHGPSGDEDQIKEFLLDYIKDNSSTWKVKPEIHADDDLFQNGFLLKFGKPRTAVFAHIDTVGFTVRYENQLISIGGPDVESGYELVGQDNMGPIACSLEVNREKNMFYKFGRAIQTGTTLTYKPDFKQDDKFIQSPYLDNRLGVYNALKLCETLENGIIAFSCWEEHGGGLVSTMARYMYDNWKVRQALISDITWVTDGVHHGDGVAISLRDRNLPRTKFVKKIRAIADAHNIRHQLEVEAGGSSDGRELQISAYPIDWCFIGAPEEAAHTPHEKVHVDDIESMLSLYEVLMEEL